MQLTLQKYNENILTHKTNKNAENSSYKLFQVVSFDHVLTYAESQGFAQLGSYIYKEAVAGERYGYPDFYERCLKEYNEATETEEVNGVTVKVHTNCHKFYDIADKEKIDEFYQVCGIAWYYGVDAENERVFLPRNDYYFKNGSIEDVGKYIEAGLPNIPDHTHSPVYSITSKADSGTNASTPLARDSEQNAVKTLPSSSTGGISTRSSDPIYGSSDTVQPPSVSVIYYMVVGNTVSTEGLTDLISQSTELLSQLNEGLSAKANKDLITNYCQPDFNAGVIKAIGEDHTAPCDGIIVFMTADYNTTSNLFINGNGILVGDTSNGQLSNVFTSFPIPKGTVYKLVTREDGSGAYLTFYPLKGANS